MPDYERRNLSKRSRFEIFKRDRFTCQYCGKTPPGIILEIDHIVAVSDGGSDEPHNLLTACFDCNRGKSSVPLSDSLQSGDLTLKRELIQERIEQAEAYELMLQHRRAVEDDAIEEVIGVYERAFEGWTLLDSTRPAIRRFLRLLSKTEVIEAMEIACARMNDDKAWRYFCGVCWRKLEK
jgi:hypothetical protein